MGNYAEILNMMFLLLCHTIKQDNVEENESSYNYITASNSRKKTILL